MRNPCLAALLAALVSSPGAAEEAPLNLPDLMQRFGWDFATAEVRAQTLADGLHVIFGIGGNVAVSIGADGVLVVDDQFPEMVPRIEQKIRELGGGDIDFAINTHWHFDHAEGNLALGPRGVRIVSHENSRAMMLEPHVINLVAMRYAQQAYPVAALPVVTYETRMSLHLNGERIDLLHFGPAHTTGDTAVFFRGRNAVHLGDVYNNTGYPFIDVDSGGDIDGAIAFCEAALAETDARTRVIPGHGPVATQGDLRDFVTMLHGVRDAIATLIADGRTLDEVKAAKPTAAFDARYGDPAGIVDRVHASLVRASSAPR